MQKGAANATPSLMFFMMQILLFYVCNCSFLHWNTTVFVVSELYDNGIIYNINNCSIETGCSKNGVSHSYFGKHQIFFFCSFFCGRIIRKYINPKITTSQIIIPNMPIPPEAEALLFAKIALINVSSYIQILKPILHNFRSLGKPFWLF